MLADRPILVSALNNPNFIGSEETSSYCQFIFLCVSFIGHHSDSKYSRTSMARTPMVP